MTFSLPAWTRGALRIFGILSSRGVALVLQLGLLAVVGRALGVEGLGIYALFVSWLTIIGTLGAFGAPMQNLRDIAVASAAGDSARVKLVFWANMRAAFIGVAVMALGLAVMSPWLQGLVPAAGPPRLLVFAAMAAIVFGVLKTTVEALKGAGRPQIAIFLESGFVPALLLFVVGAPWLAGRPVNATMLLAGHFTALLAATAVAAVVWFGVRFASVGVVDVPERQSRFVFGTTQGLGILATNLAILVLPLFLDAHAIGLYAAAQKLVSVAAVILGTLSAYFAPRFAQAFALQDARRLGSELRRSQVLSLGIYLPLFLLFVLAPRWNLVLFGPGFHEAAPLLIILAGGQLLNSATGLVAFFLNMIHEERAGLLAVGLSFVILVVSLPLLGLHLGAVGIAISMASFTAMKNLIALVWCNKSMRAFKGRWNSKTTGVPL